MYNVQLQITRVQKRSSEFSFSPATYIFVIHFGPRPPALGLNDQFRESEGLAPPSMLKVLAKYVSVVELFVQSIVTNIEKTGNLM